MYQTHNPGFCFKRNGKHKKQPAIASKATHLNFQELRSLLFTDDELDIEKTLCLYLLSTHKTDSLRMPTMKSLKGFSKENSPLERLVQRSKKINKKKQEDDILKMLPNYVIDIAGCVSCSSIEMAKGETEDELFRDSRLNSKLLVNEKIEEILIAALGALKKSKSEKFLKFLENCKDTVYIKKIFNKLSMQDYLKMLRTYSVVTSCESYYLTQKLKQQPTHIEIRTMSGNLESILLQIRMYVLLVPSKIKNEWRLLYDFDESLIEEEIDEDMLSVASRQLQVFDAPKSSKSTHLRKSCKSIASKMSTPTRRSDFLDKTASGLAKTAYKNFISRNIQAIKGESVTRKLFEDFEQDEILPKSLSANFSSKIINNDYVPPESLHYIMPSKNSETEEEMKNSEGNTRAELDDKLDERILEFGMNKNNTLIKKMKCCACQMKCKQPLPAPKIPIYPRSGLAPLIYKNPFRTNRLHQLSSMAEEGLYKLNSYDFRYSTNNSNIKIKMPKEPAVPIVPQNEVPVVANSVEINPYDLEKIAHEIANTETNKKLKKFLKDTL
ncbi:hypothetical protein WA026_001303 [Henosepilachna vigintioctopunctata]